MKVRYITKCVSLIIIMIIFSMVIPGKVVGAKSQELEKDLFSIENLLQTIELDSCDEKDPYAPCKAKLYGYITSNRSYSQTIQCRVEVENRFGTVVAKLWENVPVTWHSTGYSWSGAYRGTWTINGFYSWVNLSGPSPSSGTGSYVMLSRVVVKGEVKYMGSPWKGYEVRTNIWGRESSPGWSCSLYNY